MLVVESVEISTLSLIRELGRIADHVSIVMIPSVIVVSLESFFVVDGMNKHVVFTSVFLEFRKTLNVL
jgi:hypothetical protein